MAADWFHVQLAARIISRGGVVLHATEGVWGLTCLARNHAAVLRLLAMKRRPVEQGLIVIAEDAHRFQPLLKGLPADQVDAVHESWPGPVTWLLPRGDFPDWVTGGRPKVAARVPGHPQARSLCKAVGAPIVSTSANVSGRPAPQTQLAARAQMGRLADFLLPGTTLGRGSSEIRHLSGETLRQGGGR